MTAENKGNKKPVLVFYLGYSPDFNGQNYQTQPDVFGSEIALVHLAEALAQKYQVLAFGCNTTTRVKHKGVWYLPASDLPGYSYLPIDVLIISRYLHFFLDYGYVQARKTFLWCHDVYPNPYYNGTILPENGREVLEKYQHRLDGIIALSEWHRDFILRTHPTFPREKIVLIGNGIVIPSDSLSKEHSKKPIFVWASDPNRGLNKCIDILREVQKVLPETHLHVFREISDPIEEKWITYHGRQPNNVIVKAFAESAIWLYPTNFTETYCIVALEAQLMGAVPVCTDLAGLTDTVGDRGIRLPVDTSVSTFAETVVKLLSDEPRLMELRKAGQEWAQDQDWNHQAERWMKLF